MEEIRFKLTSLSVHLAAKESAVERLANMVTSGNDSNKDQAKELLWESLKAGGIVAQLCADRLASIAIRGGGHDLASTLSSLLSSASAKSSVNIIPAVGTILRHCPTSTKTKFGIASNPHPFVSLLRACPSSWPHVLAEMRRWEVESDNFDSLRPVILFTFCDPHHHSHFAALRSALVGWLFECLSVRQDKIASLLLTVATWINFTDAVMTAENVKLVLDIFEACQTPTDSRLPVLCAMALVMNELLMDPKQVLAEIHRLVKHAEDDVSPWTKNQSMLILARAISRMPSKHQQNVVDIILSLSDGDSGHHLVMSTCFASILQSMPHRVGVNSRLHAAVSEVRRRMEEARRDFQPSPSHSEWKHFSIHCQESDAVLRLLVNIGQSDNSALEWLGSVKELEILRHDRISPILLAIACNAQGYDDDVVVILAFELLLEMSRENPGILSHAVLTIAMNKLSLGSCSPTLRLFLLNSLPILGGADRGCIGFVLQLVNSLASRPGLKALRLRLLFELWQREPRVYVHLQQALEETAPESLKSDFLLSKAKTIRDVCAAGAGERGADLLPLLSGLLNNNTDETETAMALMSLEGISHLCKHGVIDVTTTVRVLSPKMWADPRKEVVAKFVDLLGIPPTFDIKSTSYQAFRKEVLAVLWSKVASAEPNLQRALFGCIAKFSLHDYTLQALPDFAKDELLLCNSPKAEESAGAMAGSQDEEAYIPGQCFVALLTRSTPSEHLPFYEEIVSNLVKQEIEELPRAVYYVSPAMRHRGEEPPSYNYLRESSILRYAHAFLHSFVSVGRVKSSSEDERRVAAAVLRAMMPSKSRPLPPLDWRFLTDMQAYPTIGTLSRKIAALQCAVSR